MAQISAGFNYTSTGTNSLVTAGNLNQHVNNAQLQGGAVVEQVSNPATADTDLLLIAKGGSLFKQTKLQFTDTINSNEINVNNLSAETIDVDNLSFSGATIGGLAPTLDIYNTNIVVTGAYRQMRFGYDAFTGAPPAGSGYLDDTLFGTRNFTIYNPAYGTSGRSYLNVVGKVHVQNSAGVTTDAELEVDGNVAISGNVVIDGTLTVATANPSLKASGSWTWDGTNLVPRRTPFNCSATRLGTGYYRINFTTPMSTPNYVISAVSGQWDGNGLVSMGEYGIRTSSEFYVLAQYRVFSSSGGSTDVGFDILVFD